MLDGLNPDDPGLRLLEAHARKQAPARLLSVYSGALSGVGTVASLTRLVLDTREREQGGACIATRLEGLSGCGDEGEAALTKADFDAAAFWPRAHLGKDFTLAAFARAGSLLAEGAPLWVSVRKQKGGASLARALEQLFGSVEVLARDRGYHLYEARRGDGFDTSVAEQWAQRRYEVGDPRLGEASLVTAPGVFSRKELDAGTATLIDFAEQMHEVAPKRVLDLCAGVGPLALWAALRWPECQVDAVESNLLAVSCMQYNFAAAGVDERVEAHAHAGPLSSGGPYELALINPPTHADQAATRALLAPLASQMRPGAPAYLVVSRPGRFPEILEGLGARVRAWQSDRYTIIGAKW